MLHDILSFNKYIYMLVCFKDNIHY